MTRLTSRYMRYFKVIFPAFWFGILALFTFGVISTGAGRKDPMSLVVPVAMAVFGYVFFKHLFWDLVDEVYDCGDSLLVKHRGREEHIPLSDIMNMNFPKFMSPPRVTLTLATPSIFGSEVAFSPERRFSVNPFARNGSMDQLIVRVYQARSRRAL